MPSKYCPHCGRIVNCSFIPNYCAWGCGSLKNEPVLPEFKTMQERDDYIKKYKKKIEQNQEYVQQKIIF